MATRLVQYYSDLLEKDVTPAQAVSYFSAQSAFIFTVLPIDMPFALRIVGLAWLASALISCKKSGVKAS